MKKRLLQIGWLFSVLMVGCQIQPPSGAVIEPVTLGATVDEINWRQEENAEYAKFIIYQHEFELNLQDEQNPSRGEKTESSFTYQPAYRIKGYRLTPDGESHVRQIAHVLRNQRYDTHDPATYIVVEQSDTSKRWDTKHRYPVHNNDELDAVRRQVVVEVLIAHGIENAEQMVIVAPTYPTGLTALEASAGYQNAIYNSGPSSRGGLFGR